MHDMIDSIYSLSPLQQGLLFHSVAQPESTEYFIQTRMELKGDLNLQAFEAAWKDMQVNYLRGNNMYLRKINTIYGENFLEKIANLSYSDATEDEIEEAKRTGKLNWKEYQELKNVVDRVNDELRTSKSA